MKLIDLFNYLSKLFLFNKIFVFIQKNKYSVRSSEEECDVDVENIKIREFLKGTRPVMKKREHNSTHAA